VPEVTKGSLAQRLGASRVEKLARRPSKDPLGLLQLQNEVGRRLRSTGGRPTDPSWTVSRQVPFKESTWKQLQATAEKLGVEGRRVGPAQIAAILVEQGLGQSSQPDRWSEVLKVSRSIGLFKTPEAAEAAGVTYTQFHRWTHAGWLRVTSTEGRQRLFDCDEVVRARLMRQLGQLGSPFKKASYQLSELDLSSRYVVVRVKGDLAEIGAAASLDGRTDDDALVLDQEPIRSRLIGARTVQSDETNNAGAHHGREPRRATAV
jgi:DNA-binding transcriptional MerR regulator